MLEQFELTKDNIATDSFLSVLSNVLESLSSELVKESATISDKTSVLTQTTEAYSLYVQLKNSILDKDVSVVTDLKTQLESFITNYNLFLSASNIQDYIDIKSYIDVKDSSIAVAKDSIILTKAQIFDKFDLIESYYQDIKSYVIPTNSTYNYESIDEKIRMNQVLSIVL